MVLQQSLVQQKVQPISTGQQMRRIHAPEPANFTNIYIKGNVNIVEQLNLELLLQKVQTNNSELSVVTNELQKKENQKIKNNILIVGTLKF